MTKISLDDILLSKKPVRLQHDSFPFFELDDFVPQWLYEKLEAEFPSLDTSANQYVDGKLFINSRHVEDCRDEFFAGRPYWKQLIEILESQDFASDVGRILRPYLLRHRYFGALRKWRASRNGRILSPFNRATQIAYEWSAMPQGARLMPHTDKCAKLATFVWHFPSKNWQPQYKGATQFLAPKMRKHNVNWSNFKLPFVTVIFV